ncbi:MAG: hypothetical protein IH991_23935 [Planctomycetes bacterium]|nr:hypothetical protein [Planctomycetota bacterium]
MICKANTKTGARCKNKAINDSDFCRIHSGVAPATAETQLVPQTRVKTTQPSGNLTREVKRPKRQIRRSIAVILIALAVLYFAVGAVLVWYEWLAVESYALAGGIVGSLASILGLLSLSRPSLQQSDLEQLDTQSLRSIADATEELRSLEEARSTELTRLHRTKVITRKEIDALHQQKEQMRLSVEKASLTLFLQHQRKDHERRVVQELEKAKRLLEHLTELSEIDTKLNALQAEIESDPNVDLLKTIMATAQKTKPQASTIDSVIDDLPPLTRSFAFVFREIVRAMATIMRVVLKK